MLYDEFTENNGVLLTNHTPDVGPAWDMLVGVHDIQDDHASGKTLPGGYAHARNVLPRPAKSMFTYWRTVNDVAHTRLTFRIQDDSNYVYVDFNTFGNTVLLRKLIADASTTLDTATPTIAVNTWYMCWVDITGNLIEVYHDAYGQPKPGSPILSASDSVFAIEKGVGMWAGVAGDWWDNFTVTG